jgi:hypothetical protein
MSALSKRDEAKLRSAIAHLRGENASEEVRAALLGPAKLYLQSWVIPKLEALLPENRKGNRQ